MSGTDVLMGNETRGDRRTRSRGAGLGKAGTFPVTVALLAVLGTGCAHGERGSDEPRPVDAELSATSAPPALRIEPAQGDPGELRALIERARRLGTPDSDLARHELGRGGYEAVPVILDAMRELDLEVEADSRLGNALNRALTKIAHGRDFGWRAPGDPGSADHNERVVEQWGKIWRGAEANVEYWIRFAKLDEADPSEAERLRGLHGRDQD